MPPRRSDPPLLERASKGKVWTPATTLQPRPPSQGLHRHLSSIRVRRAIECPIGPLCCSLTSLGVGLGMRPRGTGEGELSSRLSRLVPPGVRMALGFPKEVVRVAGPWTARETSLGARGCGSEAGVPLRAGATPVASTARLALPAWHPQNRSDEGGPHIGRGTL